jgi:hypothetical protein
MTSNQLGTGGSDEEDPAVLDKRWVREQPTWTPPPPPPEEEGGPVAAEGAGVGEEEVEEEEEGQRQQRQQHRDRLIGGVRAALEGQLLTEARARAAAAATTATVGALLGESERVLAALAYQDVLPPSPAPAGVHPPDASGRFADGLVPLLPPPEAPGDAAQDHHHHHQQQQQQQQQQQSAAPLPRPLFPIARFALRRRRPHSSAGVLALEVKLQAADGWVVGFVWRVIDG